MRQWEFEEYLVRWASLRGRDAERLRAAVRAWFAVANAECAVSRALRQYPAPQGALDCAAAFVYAAALEAASYCDGALFALAGVPLGVVVDPYRLVTFRPQAVPRDPGELYLPDDVAGALHELGGLIEGHAAHRLALLARGKLTDDWEDSARILWDLAPTAARAAIEAA